MPAPCRRLHPDRPLTPAFQAGFFVTRLLDRFSLAVRDVRLAPELYRHFFAWIADRYDHLIERPRNVANMVTLLERAIEHSPIAITHILDYGCGTGLSTVALREVHWPGPMPRMAWLDTCPQMRRHARTRGLSTVSLAQLRTRRYACFSTIVASYVLHLPTALSGLKDAWNLLLPGGVLVGNCHKGVGGSRDKSLPNGPRCPHTPVGRR